MIAPPDLKHQPETARTGQAEAWHLVTASASLPARQMGVDQALAESVWAGRRPPVLRLYHWQSAALTIGRNQHPGKLPWPAVRRMTGGRAVYHEDELTLCIALPAGHRLLSGGVRSAYLNMAEPLARALSALGLPALADRERKSGDAGRFSCFSAPAFGEVTVHGEKVAAIAQRLTPEGFLMQASIPLTPPVSLPGAGAARVAGLSAFLPHIQREQLSRAVQAAVARHHGITWQPEALSPQEKKRANQLAATVYRPVGGTPEAATDSPLCQSAQNCP